MRLNLFFYLLFILFGACSKTPIESETGNGPRDPENSKPTIQSISMSLEKASPGDTVTVIGTATDSDGDSLIFIWLAEAGRLITPTDSMSQWIITESVEIGSSPRLTLTVTDGIDSVSDFRTIEIIARDNVSPVIESISLSTMQAFSGDTITVTAKVSDPNGDSLQIKWSTEDGIILSPDLIKTGWIIPEDAVTGMKPSIKLTVSDGADSVSGSRSVEIIELVNNVPVITSFKLSSLEVTPGGSLQLSASASDEDGDNLSFKWSAETGELVSPDSSATSWRFPLTAQVGLIPTVSLTVSDGEDSVLTTGTVTIISGLSISGHAYFRDTRIPISDVSVSVNNLKGVTDSEGFYQIDYIPAEGDYDILALKEGFDDYKAKVTITEMNSIFDLGLNSDKLTGVLSGTMQTIDEIKLSGMKIWLINPDQSLSAVAVVSTRDGSFRLTHIPPGERRFYVANESNSNESLPDTIQLEIKASEQNINPRIKIKREVYHEAGPENPINWQKVNCEILQDAYAISGSSGFMRMIKLIDVPDDAEKLVYKFYKIIHLDGFQECHYGLFNETGEGQSFSFIAGNKTKNWTSAGYDYDERYMGHDVYLQFWTTAEQAQFLIFEIDMSFFW